MSKRLPRQVGTTQSLSERKTDKKTTPNAEKPTRTKGKYQLGDAEKSSCMVLRIISHAGADNAIKAMRIINHVCDLLAMAPNA